MNEPPTAATTPGSLVALEARRATAESKPPGSPRGAVQLSDAQADVYQLLWYAISQANIKVEDDFIESALSVLSKDASALTPQEQATLWKSYNRLSMLVHPATSESINVARQIDEEQRVRGAATGVGSSLRVVTVCRRQLRRVVWSLITILIVFVVLQAYVIFLSDILRNADQHNTAAAAVKAQIAAMTMAKPDLSEDAPPLKELSDQRDTIDAQIISTYYTLLNFSRPWRTFYDMPGDSQRDRDRSDPKQDHYRRIAVEQGAHSVLRVLNFYMLPLVLGLLGAIAFITRRLLASLESTSYTLGSGRRHTMRLALGALLGVVSGIILAPEQPSLQGFNLPLVTLAFLMGYSVEFAFSAFDALIERGRQAFKPDNLPPKP